LKQNGVFFNQPAYIPDPDERACISRVYTDTPKIGNRWFQSTDLPDIYRQAGFDICRQIGEGKQLVITEEDHIARYHIVDKDIVNIRTILQNRGTHSIITKRGYELYFDFPIFITYLV